MCLKHYKESWRKANLEAINARRRARYQSLSGERRQRHLERMRQYRKENRYPDEDRPLTQLKREIGKCQRCGYGTCLRALHWHHPESDGGGRRRADVRGLGWERARAFVAQCILICANCHAEHHAGLW
jgi:hypothetical protein